MDKHEETRTWLRFFKDAGIPKETGASYAHIFVENRIHKDMLSDLTVDYLRLMGITLMGDIIAILRHCKSVHQDSVRKVVILQSKDERRSLSSSSTGSSSSDESSDDDVEMVEVTDKSIKRNSASTKTTDNSIKKEPAQKNEVKQVKSQVVGKINSSAPAKVSVIEKKAAHSVKRKYDDDSDNDNFSQEDTNRTNQSNSGKSILRSSASAVKKITSDNDMIGPKLPPPKKTVFERLGAETEPPQVSSTTEVPLVETKFTRIINNVNLPLKSVSPTAEDDISVSSVFKRLGDVKDSPQVRVIRAALPYAGVLKSPPSIKIPVTTSKPVKIVRGTMRADEPEVPVQLRASTSDARKFTIRVGDSTTSVKSRLKTSQPTKTALLRQKTLNVGSQGIFANESQPIGVSVKQRLGLTAGSDEVNPTSTIKKRLNRPYLPAVKKITSSHDKDSGRFTPRSLVERLDTKKVSFGRTERKSISPIGILRSSGSSRPVSGGRLSIHSRLGRTRTA